MILRALITIVAIPLLSAAQQFSGEVEFTQTQKGRQEYSLYMFANAKKVSLLNRYSLVEGAVNRGEFAIGKTISAHDRLTIIPYGGLTTDGAIFTPAVFIIKIARHNVVYVADPKFYPGRKSNTLYQELSAGVDEADHWQFRWEDLRAGNFHVFARFGIEKRFQVSQKTHLFAGGFYDAQNKLAGGYSGFRWQ